MSAGASKIALSVGLCLCAGQLVATPASAAAATVAPATTAVAVKAAAAKSVLPKMTIAASKRTINRGSSTKVTARLVDPRTGKAVRKGTVRLQAWRNGAWRTYATKKVASNGYVSFISKPVTSVTMRTQFTGAPGYRWAFSRTNVRVTVKNNAGERILAEAKKHNGAKYRYGASGPRVFDCSGYTMYVYKKAVGKKLPHKAHSQQKYGKAVSKSKAQPGDLIVIRSGSHGTHAGVYAGGGYMYDSPRAGKTVGKHKIWSRNYVVRRLA
jgi:cell wall-associated NlpC family hydrolase